VAIAVTLRLFLSQDRAAGWCIAPYLAWVSFAVLLNIAILRLNG
jgi:benzodiazapine receptor